MNTPYVKQYAEDGTVSNPIKVAYVSQFANRRQRRYKSKERLNIGQFIDRGPASREVIPATKRGKNGKFTVITR